MTEELRSMAVILSIINSRSTAIGSGEWMDSLTKPDDRTTARHFGKLQPPSPLPPPSVHQSSGKWYESSPPPPSFHLTPKTGPLIDDVDATDYSSTYRPTEWPTQKKKKIRGISATGLPWDLSNIQTFKVVHLTFNRDPVGDLPAGPCLHQDRVSRSTTLNCSTSDSYQISN